jgi:hypothetical protein
MLAQDSPASFARLYVAQRTDAHVRERLGFVTGRLALALGVWRFPQIFIERAP